MAAREQQQMNIFVKFNSLAQFPLFHNSSVSIPTCICIRVRASAHIGGMTNGFNFIFLHNITVRDASGHFARACTLFGQTVNSMVCVLLICKINIHIPEFAIEFNFRILLWFSLPPLLPLLMLPPLSFSVLVARAIESNEEKGVQQMRRGEIIKTIPVHVWLFQCAWFMQKFTLTTYMCTLGTGTFHLDCCVSPKKWMWIEECNQFLHARPLFMVDTFNIRSQPVLSNQRKWYGAIHFMQPLLWRFEIKNKIVDDGCWRRRRVSPLASKDTSFFLLLFFCSDMIMKQWHEFRRHLRSESSWVDSSRYTWRWPYGWNCSRFN